MARGKILGQNKKFENYNYMIMGVPGVGKTLLAANIGEVVAGDVRGTMVVTLGREPIPEHLGEHVFNDYCPTFEELAKATKDYCEERNTTYKTTKFIALDSLDELFRLAEQYVVKEWNRTCKPEERAKSISQAYKGFQKGENRVVDLVLDVIGKLEEAGYKLIFIAHTKKKTVNDEYSEISFEQIVCSVDNKYYNCIKDKVNLLATCYFKNVFENVKTVKNAFTKGNMEKGKLIGRKRVIVLDSKKLSIDIKAHWSTLPDEIPLNAKLFIETVEKGIAAETEAINKRINMSAEDVSDVIEAIEPDEEEIIDDIAEDISDKEVDTSEDIIEDVFDDVTDSDEDDADIDEVDEVEETEEDEVETSDFDRDLIKAEFKKATREVKEQIKAILATHGNGKVDGCDDEGLAEICDILGI